MCAMGADLHRTVTSGVMVTSNLRRMAFSSAAVQSESVLMLASSTMPEPVLALLEPAGSALNSWVSVFSVMVDIVMVHGANQADRQIQIRNLGLPDSW